MKNYHFPVVLFALLLSLACFSGCNNCSDCGNKPPLNLSSATVATTSCPFVVKITSNMTGIMASRDAGRRVNVFYQLDCYGGDGKQIDSRGVRVGIVTYTIDAAGSIGAAPQVVVGNGDGDTRLSDFLADTAVKKVKLQYRVYQDNRNCKEDIEDIRGVFDVTEGFLPSR